MYEGSNCAVEYSRHLMSMVVYGLARDFLPRKVRDMWRNHVKVPFRATTLRRIGLEAQWLRIIGSVDVSEEVVNAFEARIVFGRMVENRRPTVPLCGQRTNGVKP
jgi:hypothetical protein